MFQAKEEVIFHDVVLMCHESHFIQRMFFFYKRMVQTWVRKYKCDEYTDEVRRVFLRNLESKITRKELQYIFKLATDRSYIIPHIDNGRFRYNTSRRARLSQEDRGVDDLRWFMFEAEEGDCAILADKETRKRLLSEVG